MSSISYIQSYEFFFFFFFFQAEDGIRDKLVTGVQTCALPISKINGYLGELEQIGCEFKGFDEGLVDFHGRLDEREILWCWKFGEDRITHWHELEAGFAGRQPLPEVMSRT